MKKSNEHKVKNKVMLLVSILLVFFVSIIVYNQHIDLNNRVSKDMDKLNKIINKYSHTQVNSIKNCVSTQTDAMLEIKGVAEALAQKDRDKLYSLVKQFYKNFLKSSEYLKIMTFRLTDGSTFLRVHKPQMYGDKLNKNRKIIIAANKTKKRQYGFEVGKLKMTYRVVTPIFYNGKHIGVVEVGILPESITDKLKSLFEDTKYALLVKQKDTSIMLKKNDKRIVLKDSGYLMARGDNLFKGVIQKIDLTKEKNIIDIKDDKYTIYTNVNLLDYKNNSAAKIILAYNMKKYIEESHQLLLNSTVKIIFLLIVLYIVLNYTFNHFISKLEESRENLKDLNLNLETNIEERTRALKLNYEKLQQTQAHLAQTEKLASLGGMVAGVAHEINTPVGMALTGITHNQESLDKITFVYNDEGLSEEDFSEYLEDTKEINDAIHVNLTKAAELVKSFKQVAVDQTSDENRIFKFREYVDEILASLHNKLKRANHEITVDIDENLTINSNPGAFSQIITNFIMNSVLHAFKDNEAGIMTIKFNIVKDNLILIYTDNGQGIEKSEQPKIFNPFYTTKRNTGGSGLGMNIVYNIITQKLNGTINLISEVGKGVKFIVTIPYKG